MQISIRYFAALREATGSVGETLVTAEGATVADLRALLARQRPSLAPLLPRCAAAVNHAYAADETPLRDGDELAFLPPVGGG
jgi:sulfur-carrier protein